LSFWAGLCRLVLELVSLLKLLCGNVLAALVTYLFGSPTTAFGNDGGVLTDDGVQNGVSVIFLLLVFFFEYEHEYGGVV